MKFSICVAASAFMVSGMAQAETLHLVCLGAGSANKQTSTNVYAQDSAGNSGWAQATGSRAVPFGDQVNLEINDDDTGRIRVPRSMLPKLHGGEGGWFNLKNIRKTDDEITGTAEVNFINSPKVRLDRRTGAIAINGKAGDYSGECQKFDPASAERRF
jgi:hypothetical protein